MDDDDGLMLNFAPVAASPSKRPKQTAKARFAQKRTAQQQRRQAVNGISENSVVATAYASPPRSGIK
ncbi:hypothetical protein NDA15_006788 [Ustilago hordei]|nr:hypothetical protein NDA15_006788 [Ustilago hordei]